jgi:hypothetical protein
MLSMSSDVGTTTTVPAAPVTMPATAGDRRDRRQLEPASQRWWFAGHPVPREHEALADALTSGNLISPGVPGLSQEVPGEAEQA